MRSSNLKNSNVILTTVVPLENCTMQASDVPCPCNEVTLQWWYDEHSPVKNILVVMDECPQCGEADMPILELESAWGPGWRQQQLSGMCPFCHHDYICAPQHLRDLRLLAAAEEWGPESSGTREARVHTFIEHSPRWCGTCVTEDLADLQLTVS